MATNTDEKAPIAVIEGYRVFLDYQKRFIAFGKDVAEKEALWADSFAKLKEKVNEHVLKLAAAERKTHKVTLPVITDLCVKAVVTGIHPRTRKLNGIGEKAKDLIYPDVPWIVQLLEEKARLAERIDAIIKELKPYAITKEVPGWGEMSAVLYETATHELKKEYADALIAAQKVEQTMAAVKESKK